jgi:hypothetical protein
MQAEGFRRYALLPVESQKATSLGQFGSRQVNGVKASYDRRIGRFRSF